MLSATCVIPVIYIRLILQRHIAVLGLEKRVFGTDNGVAKLPKWLNGVVVLDRLNSRGVCEVVC